MQKVGKREKGEEGSAWPLCSGLPLSAAGAAQVEVREGFTQGLHGDSAVRVRPRAPTTHSPLPSSPSSLEKSSVLPLSAAGAAQVEVRERFTQGSHGDSAAQVEVREGFTQGLHGASAVRSIMEAHCIVSTHYLLLSSPSSLLWHALPSSLFSLLPTHIGL